MKLNHIFSAAAVALSGLLLPSCADILKTETESFVDLDGLPSYNANDSVYSAMGVVSQLQKLGERYVMLGELRGDLVEVPATAPTDYQEISDFKATSANSFSPRHDYFGVINNCNIALNRLDTLITEHNRAVLLKDYVSIRAVRDWTYLQLGLTYGKTIWISEKDLAEKGLESLNDAEANYPTVELDRLVDLLIEDLTPFAGHDTSDYGTVDEQGSTTFFISPMLLLADLNLYKNNYETAANLYHSYMVKKDLTITQSNGIVWSTASATDLSQTGGFDAYRNETIVQIPYATSAAEYHTDLVNRTYSPEPYIIPASWWMREMNTAQHLFARSETAGATSLLEGDTRGEVRFATIGTPARPAAFLSTGLTTYTTPALITKFFNNAVGYSEVTNPGNPIFENGGQAILRSVVTYRVPHVYLRYAEAINRAGKPSMAFAVLKYGLRNDVLNNEVDPKIDPEEWENREEWLNFEDSRFDSNRGVATRGLGYGVAFSADYSMPEFETTEEKVAWVEEQILREMAAETAFEGNRFFDLLRMSRHQSAPEAWFAAKVSRRFADPAAAASRLSDSSSWWLK